MAVVRLHRECDLIRGGTEEVEFWDCDHVLHRLWLGRWLRRRHPRLASIPCDALTLPADAHEAVVLCKAGGIVMRTGVVGGSIGIHIGVVLPIERDALRIIRIPADPLIAPSNALERVALAGAGGVVMVSA